MSFFINFFKLYVAKLNKYVLVIIVFLTITFTVGDSNLYKRHRYDEKIQTLEKEIKYYQKEIEINRKKLEDLHTSQERLERFAREEYYMKNPDEDVFIIMER